MPNYVRRYAPGGTFFFTVVTHRRRPVFSSSRGRSFLREAIQQVRRKHPFDLVATVLLPDHWHCVWTLPQDDCDYSRRLGLIKSCFSKLWLSAGEREATISAARARRREHGIWQRRFWEHTIRDEGDFMRHVNYIHYNPVKHGLTRCPHGWPHSSFRRWIEEGYYREDWLCDCKGRRQIVPDNLREGSTFGE